MGESFVESVMLKLTKYKNINDGFKDGFKNGCHKSCDMTVEDIYGGGCEFLGNDLHTFYSFVVQINPVGIYSGFLYYLFCMHACILS